MNITVHYVYFHTKLEQYQDREIHFTKLIHIFDWARRYVDHSDISEVFIDGKKDDAFRENLKQTVLFHQLNGYQ